MYQSIIINNIQADHPGILHRQDYHKKDQQIATQLTPRHQKKNFEGQREIFFSLGQNFRCLKIVDTLIYLLMLMFVFVQLLQVITSMKVAPAFQPNKKLILHFDLDFVIRLPPKVDKDLLIYELAASWVWGKFERNSKEDPDRITGWKIASNSLSLQSPQADLVSYKTYLQDFVRPPKEQYEKLILGLSKGPAGKAKSQIEKNIKNISLPKAVYEALKESGDGNNRLQAYFNRTGKYQLLPGFFKLILGLRKAKREFAIVIKGGKEGHQDVIEQLNLFFGGEHPLFNGKNGTTVVKWDGSKGSKNFLLADSHQAAYFKQSNILFAAFGQLSPIEQKDVETLRQRWKNHRSVRLCEGTSDIYAVSHSIFSEGACIYQANPQRVAVIDPTDYLTHQIYFSSETQPLPTILTCLGDLVPENTSSYHRVSLFDLLRDPDYLLKTTEVLEQQRAQEIQRAEKGQGEEPEAEVIVGESNHAFLRRKLLPVLEGALKQVDLLRPADPIGFIALYCLRNRDKLE